MIFKGAQMVHSNIKVAMDLRVNNRGKQLRIFDEEMDSLITGNAIKLWMFI